MGKKIAKLEDDMGGLDEMAKKVGIKFDGTETDAQKQKELQDGYEAILANGGTLNARQQKWLDIRIEQQELDATINDIDAEPDPEKQLEMIKAAPTDVVYKAESNAVIGLADVVIEKEEDAADISDTRNFTKEERGVSKMSALERMRAARASMPGKDIESETMPEMKEHFVAAVNNDLANKVVEPVPAQNNIDLALT